MTHSVRRGDAERATVPSLELMSVHGPYWTSFRPMMSHDQQLENASNNQSLVKAIGCCNIYIYIYIYIYIFIYIYIYRSNNMCISSLRQPLNKLCFPCYYRRVHIFTQQFIGTLHDLFFPPNVQFIIWRWNRKTDFLLRPESIMDSYVILRFNPLAISDWSFF